MVGFNLLKYKNKNDDSTPLWDAKPHAFRFLLYKTGGLMECDFDIASLRPAFHGDGMSRDAGFVALDRGEVDEQTHQRIMDLVTGINQNLEADNLAAEPDRILELLTASA